MYLPIVAFVLALFFPALPLAGDQAPAPTSKAACCQMEAGHGGHSDGGCCTQRAEEGCCGACAKCADGQCADCCKDAACTDGCCKDGCKNGCCQGSGACCGGDAACPMKGSPKR